MIYQDMSIYNLSRRRPILPLRYPILLLLVCLLVTDIIVFVASDTIANTEVDSEALTVSDHPSAHQSHIHQAKRQEQQDQQQQQDEHSNPDPDNVSKRPPLLRQHRIGGSHSHALLKHRDHTNDTNSTHLVSHGSHYHRDVDVAADSGYILMIMIAVLLICQVALFLWKKYSVRSFDMASLFGLWIIPFIVSIIVGYWRMLIIWCSYSIATAVIMKKAWKRGVHKTTPRLVYKSNTTHTSL